MSQPDAITAPTDAAAALSRSGPARPLGLIEQTFATMHEQGLQMPIVVAGIGERIDRDALQKVVEHIWSYQPMFQMRILEDDPDATPVFYWGAPAPIVVEVEEELSEWPRVADEGLPTAFEDATGPLWRVSLVQHPDAPARSTLVLTFHHAVEDGTTAMRVLHELLEGLRCLDAGGTLPRREMFEVPPPVELATGARLSFFKKVAVVLFGIWRAIRPAKLFLERDDVPFEERETRVICRTMEPERVKALLARCRQESTTVQGALIAAMLATMARRIDPARKVRLQCDTSISLRDATEPAMGDEIAGLYFSSVSDVFTCGPQSDFWDLARHARASILERVERRYHILALLLLGWLPRKLLREYMTGTPARQQALFISNMGRYAYGDDEAERFPLETFYCGSSQHGSGACFWLGTLTVARTLFFSFLYCHPLITPETAEAMADEVLERLDEAVRGGALLAAGDQNPPG